jgi:hypothetical protein
MHRADVVLIGPIEPLLPRVVRVPLPVAVAGAVSVFCAALVAAVVMTFWPVATGLLPIAASGTNSASDVAPIVVVSQPVGAEVHVDNRELGRTPATVNVARDAVLVLHRDGFLDSYVATSSPGVNVQLWRAQPVVQQVRPPTPGTSIASADFLPDGRVALSIELPPAGERQAWAYDPVAARAERLGSIATPGAAVPSRVAIAPDAVHTANIVQLDGLDNAPADQLTIDGPEGSQQPLGSVVGERLLDVSWSPRSDGVLVLSRRQVAGAVRYQLRFARTDGQLRDVGELPVEPLAGSWVWASSGDSVAFLVHTVATTSLVTLDLSTGDLRYLDDLTSDTLPVSGAIAPAAWKPSGELLYSGPPRADGTSAGAGPVLYQVAPLRTDAHRVGDVQPVWAPAVQSTGTVITLARAENDGLVLRPIDTSGHVLAEQRLGIQVAGAFAARWDLVHRQILIVRGSPGGGIDVLLARFGADDLTGPRVASGDLAEPVP